jgi:hypothetical protein
MERKYKYLCYVPAPVNLQKDQYDLVDDHEFCKPDGRIPLLLATQYGIFPSGNYTGKKNYRNLEGLENQRVGFIGRGYLSCREREGILVLLVDTCLLHQIRCEDFSIDLSFWAANSENYFRWISQDKINSN